MQNHSQRMKPLQSVSPAHPQGARVHHHRHSRHHQSTRVRHHLRHSLRCPRQLWSPARRTMTLRYIKVGQPRALIQPCPRQISALTAIIPSPSRTSWMTSLQPLQSTTWAPGSSKFHSKAAMVPRCRTTQFSEADLWIGIGVDPGTPCLSHLGVNHCPFKTGGANEINRTRWRG